VLSSSDSSTSAFFQRFARSHSSFSTGGSLGSAYFFARPISRMDKQQNSVLIAVIAFNVVIIGYQYLFNWDPFSWLRFLLGAFLASIAAGVAFAVAAMKK
jgi:hypothetical protein